MSIFINFRNGDGHDMAVAIDQHARVQFGDDRVFRSSRSILPGADYRPVLVGGVEDCLVLLAVIGPNWLAADPVTGRRRIDDPEDWVRREIRTALELGKMVIPVLIDRANRPRPDELPEDIAELANLQSISLNSRSFDRDIRELLEKLIIVMPDLGIGVVPGVADLREWWSAWTEATEPRLPVDLPLSGRADEVARLTAWLAGPPSVLSLGASSINDGVAFVAAAVKQHLKLRAVFVNGIEGAAHCERLLGNLLVVLNEPETDANRLVNLGQHVIVLRRRSTPSRILETIDLPLLSRAKAHEAFERNGVPAKHADRLAAIARRSLTALRRRLSPNSAEPPWANSQDVAIAAPLLLVASWAATSEFDREALNRLTGRDWEEVQSFLERTTDDPLVHRTGGRWQLVDPPDAWAALAEFLNESRMARWHQVAFDVLTETDPVLALPPAERATAMLRGVSRRYSDELREGIAIGAALLGAAADTELPAGDTAEAYASALVRDVLQQANQDVSGSLWQSLAPELPLLAEASPDAFLVAVRSGLHGIDPLLRHMFTDQTDSRDMTGRFSPHTYLLWALEGLCWSPIHLPLATRVLARLAEIDPGGKTTSRPRDSLRRVFYPLYPGTSVSMTTRLAVLDGLRAAHPAAWWNLVRDLLPSNEGIIGVRTHQPEFRDDWYSAESTPIPQNEWAAALDPLLERALDGLRETPTRWLEFLDQISAFPAAQQDRIIGHLVGYDPTSLPGDDLLALWEGVSALAAHHRQYADTTWSLHDEALRKLTRWTDRYEPTDRPERHARLFGWHPDVPGVDPFDHANCDRVLRELQLAAVREVVDQHGIDGLNRLGGHSERPDVIGSIVADAGCHSLINELITLLGSPDHLGQLASGWAQRSASQNEATWTRQVIGQLADLPTTAQTALLLAVHPIIEVEELLENSSDETKNNFWQSVSPWPPVGEPTEFFEQLLAHARPWSAATGLWFGLHRRQDWKPPTDLVARTLQMAASHRDEAPKTSHNAQAIKHLLDYLDLNSPDKLAVVQLELIYRTFLSRIRKPIALYRWISENPESFVELVHFADPAAEANQGMRISAYFALHECRHIPGVSSDGRIDDEFLKAWVRQVRELLADYPRESKRGDTFIGGILSSSPPGQDGDWPAEVIRDLLDEPDVDHLISGFLMGLSNNRGVTWRGPHEGGQQERTEAGQYDEWADRIAARWPQAAQVLRHHAIDLRAQGRHWDKRADEDQDKI